MSNKKLYIMIVIVGILAIISGGTLAYWTWQSSESQKTVVNFTVTSTFSCSVDGGGNITESDVNIVPASCTNSNHAIMREVKVNATTIENISYDLWLDIKTLGQGLSDSQNFKYALTTSNTSCDMGVISSGSFNGKTAGGKVNLLENTYSQTTNETYYLYVWLDKEETSSTTMNQNFKLSLNGSCTNSPYGPPSKPVVEEGMIPVTIANDGKVTTIKEDDANWYNYDNKQWANAVLVNSTSRSNYVNTANVTIPESDILAYYVWIPRYKYKIPPLSCSKLENPTLENNPYCYSYDLSESDKTSLIAFLADDWGVSVEEMTSIINEALITGMFNGGTGSYGLYDNIDYYNNENEPDITYTTKFSPSNNVKEPRTIDIAFESSKTQKSSGDGVNSFRTHSAFTFGNSELDGIWVGKFEATGSATTPTIKPNVSSLSNQDVSTQFATSLKFAGGTQSGSTVTFVGNNTYGLSATTNSHMMKNSEWGAVAYLSHSKYGTNKEIRRNNYFESIGGIFRTGCGASADDAASSPTCDIAYGSGVADYPQSTTGNISGVFDMSGGSWEYVMGVSLDSEGNPRSGYKSNINSGFNGLLTDGTSFTSGIAFPESKYYDTYAMTSNSVCTIEACGGHALFETESWYGDHAFFVNSFSPWFERGGSTGPSATVGVFALYDIEGDASYTSSWRSVIVRE